MSIGKHTSLKEARAKKALGRFIKEHPSEADRAEEDNVSGIEWTEQTWNPITGCDKVSQGCAHCYAERIALKHWGSRKFNDVQLHPDRLSKPKERKKGTLYFINSMSDLFHPVVPFSFIEQAVQVMRDTPQHRYQTLTKRPARMLEFFLERTPPSNSWWGTSIEDQQAADERLPSLQGTAVSNRFLSCEPLLSPVILDLANIGWVIVGGESGSKCRKMNPDWALDILLQCRKAKVPFFMKQMGGYRGGDWFDQFPAELKVREYPNGMLPSSPPPKVEPPSLEQLGQERLI